MSFGNIIGLFDNIIRKNELIYNIYNRFWFIYYTYLSLYIIMIELIYLANITAHEKMHDKNKQILIYLYKRDNSYNCSTSFDKYKAV